MSFSPATSLVESASEGTSSARRDDLIAFLYASSDHDLGQSALMGRHVANRTFVEAYARHARAERHYAVCERETDFEDFERVVREASGRAESRCARIPRLGHEELGDVGAVYLPTCAVGHLAWLRRRGDQRAFSICGIIHSIADAPLSRAIAEILVAPVQKWDALVCTSRAGRSAVQALLEQWREYLDDRLGARTDATPIELPVIPLGVDSDAFPTRAAGGAWRTSWRARLQIEDDDCAVLYRGRLDFRTKSNPTAMYGALERASQQTRRRVHLVHYGWFADADTRRAFEEAAPLLCPSVRCHFVSGRGEESQPEKGIWYAADFFTSLSDNVQETFGLAPLEAMAAGLPVVVSDWDGYRETVRNGVDGFTVPTLAPGAGEGAALTHHLEAGILDYSGYVGNASLATSVDVVAAARAYAALIDGDDLRRAMGAAARRRAQQEYDWKHVVARVQALWRDLATLRRDAGVPENAPRRRGRCSNPLRPDPFTYFASFPTAAISATDVIGLVPSDPDRTFASASQLALNRYGLIATGPERARQVVFELCVRSAGSTVGDLLSRVRPADVTARVDCCRQAVG